jgi:hypothetical protein
VFGVVAPHEALQFREFSDHVRDEIRLRKFCGATGQRSIGAQFSRDRRGDRGHARRPLSLRAEFVVIDDVGELRQP